MSKVSEILVRYFEKKKELADFQKLKEEAYEIFVGSPNTYEIIKLTDAWRNASSFAYDHGCWIPDLDEYHFIIDNMFCAMFADLYDAEITRDKFENEIEPYKKAFDEYVDSLKAEIEECEAALSTSFDEFVKNKSKSLDLVDLILLRPEIKDLIMDFLTHDDTKSK